MIYNGWSTPIEHIQSPVEGLLDHLFTFTDTSQINYNILESDSKPIKLLKETAYNNFKNYINRCFGVDIDTYHTEMNGWLLKSSSTGYNHPYHNHMGAMFSSVYYPLCEEDMGGEIRFHDPRHNANRGYDENFKKHFASKTIAPKTNDAVIFPSFLYHSVDTFTGGIRIALPIDIMLIRRKD